MSVVVTLRGGLGNNLFQYAFGRIVAEHHQLAFKCVRAESEPSFSAFLGHSVDSGPLATLEQSADWFRNAPVSIEGRVMETPTQAFEVNRESSWGGQSVDLASILKDRTPRRISLDGYFQRYEYFAPYSERIRHWFALRPATLSHDVQRDDVLLNIRRGFDFGVLNWTVSMSYYHQVLASMRNRGRVYVCGTCIDSEVRDELRQYEPTYYESDPIGHLQFITAFNRIVLSNSTFAWWGAFLSDASEIYAPRSPDGKAFGYTGWRDVDLHMGEGRYREIVGVQLAKFAPLSPTHFAMSGSRSRLHVESEEMLAWMIHQNAPVSIAEVQTRYGHLDFCSALKQLLDLGFVSAGGGYVRE